MLKHLRRRKPIADPKPAGPERFSQYGEDEIIARLINDATPRVCCEIGSNDGLHLSNTAFLWRNGWDGFLFEMDPQYEPTLDANTRDRACSYEIVEVTRSNVNEIVPKNCGVLSIDIDGDDYLVWEALKWKPEIVVIEFNPTIPYWLDVVGKTGSRYGASVGALIRLGESKGYSLMDATTCNLIFSTVFDRTLGPMRHNLEELIGRENLCYLTTDYDGKPYPIGTMPFGFKC